MSVLTRLSPWVAKPLSDATKDAYFRRRMDVAAESVLLGRSAIIAGWTVGIIGAACLAASIYGWVTFLPLKTVETRFYMVDRSTGIISQPVSLQDAPRIFSVATERFYLKRYLIAREGFDPNTDRANAHQTDLMSTPDEQVRYQTWRQAYLVPLGAQHAHISIDNLRFHAEPAQRVGARRYLVQFDRTVWHDMTRDPTQTWSALIDFSWRPDLPMRPIDRDDNPGGLQIFSYSASNDNALGGNR